LIYLKGSEETMQQFTMDFRKVEKADLSKGVPVRFPSHRVFSPADRAIAKTALEFGKPFNSNCGTLLEHEQMSEKRPSLVVLPSPAVASPTSSFDLTATIGPNLSAGVIIGLTLTSGYYISWSGEWGVFVTGGGMLGAIVGVSGGFEFAVVALPPSGLVGTFWAVGFSGGSPGWGPYLGGSIIFGGSPVAIVGSSIRFGGGFAKLPVQVELEWTKTATWPKVLGDSIGLESEMSNQDG
jgi:hypothetical protein